MTFEFSIGGFGIVCRALCYEPVDMTRTLLLFGYVCRGKKASWHWTWDHYADNATLTFRHRSNTKVSGWIVRGPLQRITQ